MSNDTFLIKSNANQSFGTGFCIYKDEQGSFLLTNAHVVEACGEDNLEVDEFKAMVFKVGISDSLDLALIYVEGLVDSIALKLSSGTIKKGAHFYISGFREHLYSNYKLETLNGSIKKISKLYTKKEKFERYELKVKYNDTVQKGYSGSAVRCLNGYVVAIATSRYTNREFEAIPIKYLNLIWNDMPNNLMYDEPCKGNNKFKITLSKIVQLSTIIGLLFTIFTFFSPRENENHAFVVILAGIQNKIDKLNKQIDNSKIFNEKKLLNKELKELNIYKIQKNIEIKKLKKFLSKIDNEIFTKSKKILEESSIDKVLEFLSEVKNKNKNIYILEIQLYMIQNNYFQAKKVYQKLLEVDKSINTLFDYAFFLQNYDNKDEAIEIYSDILNLYNNTSSNEDIQINVLNNMAVIYSDRKEFQKAEELYLKSINFAKKLLKKESTINNKFILGRNYYNLATNYEESQYRVKLEKSALFYKKAIKLYKELCELNSKKYTKFLVQALNAFGGYYSKIEKNNKSILLYNEALSFDTNNADAYINLFELQLIIDGKFNKRLEDRFIVLYKNQQEVYCEYEMLKIFQNIVDNKKINIGLWLKKYELVKLNWNFNLLKKWITTIDDKEVKEKLELILNEFSEHDIKLNLIKEQS
jgi:tetratricopeptide (TPR) repeat protein